MTHLRLVSRKREESGSPAAEIDSCAFSPDGGFLIAGTWDGSVDLWEISTNTMVSRLPASTKAISAITMDPNNGRWITGSLDGMLTTWDPHTHQPTSSYLAHTRPISDLVFSPDGELLASASWDRSVILWGRGRPNESRSLTGHEDIVAGCQFTPEGGRLVSWSHDRTMRLWDVTTGRCHYSLSGHMDRVNTASVSPDGQWLISGGRDRLLILWDLVNGVRAHTVCMGAEIRESAFLPDAESLLSVDAHGRVVHHRVPDLAELSELATRQDVLCASLSPLGTSLALGCADGFLRQVILEVEWEAPFIVIPVRREQIQQSRIERFFGKRRITHSYSCVCPVCRRSFDLADGEPGKTASCPACQRALKLGLVARVV